jgi:hypothetical protein
MSLHHQFLAQANYPDPIAPPRPISPHSAHLYAVTHHPLASPPAGLSNTRLDQQPPLNAESYESDDLRSIYRKDYPRHGLNPPQRIKPIDNIIHAPLGEKFSGQSMARSDYPAYTESALRKAVRPPKDSLNFFKDNEEKTSPAAQSNYNSVFIPHNVAPLPRATAPRSTFASAGAFTANSTSREDYTNHRAAVPAIFRPKAALYQPEGEDRTFESTAGAHYHAMPVVKTGNFKPKNDPNLTSTHDSGNLLYKNSVSAADFPDWTGKFTVVSSAKPILTAAQPVEEDRQFVTEKQANFTQYGVGPPQRYSAPKNISVYMADHNSEKFLGASVGSTSYINHGYSAAPAKLCKPPASNIVGGEETRDFATDYHANFATKRTAVEIIKKQPEVYRRTAEDRDFSTNNRAAAQQIVGQNCVRKAYKPEQSFLQNDARFDAISTARSSYGWDAAKAKAAKPVIPTDYFSSNDEDRNFVSESQYHYQMKVFDRK